MLEQAPQDYNYNISYTTKKDPQQDYSGFAYALNNLFRSGALNNGLSGLLGMQQGQDIFSKQQSPYANLFPLLADYFWGNKFRTTDTGSTQMPNFYFPMNNQNNTQPIGGNNVTQM